MGHLSISYVCLCNDRLVVLPLLACITGQVAENPVNAGRRKSFQDVVDNILMVLLVIFLH